MTLHKPWTMQPAISDPDLTYTAQEIRMVATGLARLRANQVLTGFDYQVLQRGAGANFSVDVAAGIGGVLGDDITNQGLYVVWNDATVNVATPTAPVSGTRVHRLVLQVRDKQSSGTYTTYDAVLSVLPDTGGGTPAEPASALTLAFISITVGQASVTNANITPAAPLAQSVFTASGQAFASTGDVNATGLSGIPVAAALYRIRASLLFTQGGGTPTQTVKAKGPTASLVALAAEYSQQTASDTPSFVNVSALNTAITSPGYAAGRNFFLRLDGTITFSAAGLFSLTGATSTGGSISLLAGSVMDLELG